MYLFPQDPEHHNIDDSPSKPEENSFEHAYMPSTEGTTGSRKPEDHDGRDIGKFIYHVVIVQGLTGLYGIYRSGIA